MDGGAWWAAVHGVAEGRTRLSDFTFTFPFHALEKEMATHSSVLVEKILLRETPSGGPLPRHGGGGIGGWERPEVFLFCSGDPLTVW